MAYQKIYNKQHIGTKKQLNKVMLMLNTILAICITKEKE